MVKRKRSHEVPFIYTDRGLKYLPIMLEGSRQAAMQYEYVHMEQLYYCKHKDYG